jgi:septal ring factor EnvC (AmiA/AmiB activator)
MEQLENLARLEEAIDKLLRSQQEMQQEKVQLQAKLARQEQEAAELRQQLEDALGERGKIHQRVAGLIDSIEKWEKMSGGLGQTEEAGTKAAESKTLF